MLARAAEPVLTRSEAETLALALFRSAELAEPQANVLVEGYEVDFLWETQRVVAEIDGFAFHSSPAEFERDRLRDAMLAAAGYRVVRVTWRQLTRGRDAVIARLAGALAR
jgi:very-short-patch-repair endonuclease